MRTLEHFPVSKAEGGKAAVDNAILAHRLCNRLDRSLRVGRSHERDLERIRGRDPPQQCHRRVRRAGRGDRAGGSDAEAEEDSADVVVGLPRLLERREVLSVEGGHLRAALAVRYPGKTTRSASSTGSRTARRPTSSAATIARKVARARAAKATERRGSLLNEHRGSKRLEEAVERLGQLLRSNNMETAMWADSVIKEHILSEPSKHLPCRT